VVEARVMLKNGNRNVINALKVKLSLTTNWRIPHHIPLVLCNVMLIHHNVVEISCYAASS